MIKGRYTTVYISIFLHAALLITVFLLSPKQSITPLAVNKAPAIKSYIYRPNKVKGNNKPIIKATIHSVKPITPIKKEVSQKNIASLLNQKEPDNKVHLEEDRIKEARTKEESSPLEKVTPPRVEIVKEQQKKNTSEIAKIAEIAKPKMKPLPVSTLSLSSHRSLANLRNTINQQLAEDTFKEHTQVRSASVMHADQIPVPHSTVPLTVEEKHEKTTSKSHTQSITKNDNGTCTIVREQILGSPVEASVSSFSCGESKFDKSFREHMKKVNEKFVTYKSNL